ncbi:hypothetical protein Y032_0011g1506 [Ancylostoma ceylanicum]|uniref:Uncharacterized protein n=1 Tax=Ancylostoma ceylanicum TaxID=53326 RepID=A0A016VGY1_9BILA|nr:hypothetical protein Y032_0011g1506 [Ancylostoma ceylanicum]
MLLGAAYDGLDKNSQRQHLRSSSAEGFAFAKGKFRSRTPRKMSAEMWGKGSIRQRKGSIRQKLDRHSKEAVKLKQSSGEGGSNSHDKPSKEALKSKRSSGEGGLRPQEKPSLERVHKMSAEGRLKVQEKQSLERIHRMSAEGKLKAQEKLSSGERIPKVTQDAKGNENKDLKKSPAKPTVVPVPTKETGKPLELKNSMRQQVLKSPTDKPKVIIFS